MNHLRLLLFPFSMLYGIITMLRNKLYDWQIIKSYSPHIISICLGNLNTGGTGKTPHTEYLIRLLQKKYNLAVLSRGYGRKTKGYRLISDMDTAQTTGDEPLQYFKKFPDIKVAVCEKRHIGITNLLNKFPELKLILLDDAYQHRKVNPSIRILLTEYASPYFTDFVLPAGNLREYRCNYKKADIIVVTKTPHHISDTDKEKFIHKINPLRNQTIFFSSYTYQKAYNLENNPIEFPKNAAIMLLTGIANPKPLYQYLSYKLNIHETLYFNDHHAFTYNDLIKINAIFNKISSKPKYIITTEKDYIRLLQLKKDIEQLQLPICYIPIEVSFQLENKRDFDANLLALINKKLNNK